MSDELEQRFGQRPVVEAHEAFHPIRDALRKRYRYVIHDGPVRDVGGCVPSSVPRWCRRSLHRNRGQFRRWFRRAFGRVVAGLDTVDAIVSADRDNRDNPLQPIRIVKAEVLDGLAALTEAERAALTPDDAVDAAVE